MEKTKTMWLPNGEKFENMFIPFDRMYERDTHTHTQTHTAWWHRPCLHSIARLKPTYSKKQSKKQATLVDLAWKRGQWPAKFTNKLHSTKLRTFNLKMKQLLCIQIFTMYKKLSIIHSVVNLPQTHQGEYLQQYYSTEIKKSAETNHIPWTAEM